MAVLDPRQKTQQEALAKQRANTAAAQAAKKSETKPPEGSAAPPTSSLAEDKESYVYKVEKADKNGSVDVTYPVPQAKNLYGANLDVVTSLDLIKFEQFGDGSMRNAIAYIVPWERGGTASKTEAKPTTGSLFRDGALDDLASSIWSGDLNADDLDLGIDTSGLDTDFTNPIKWDEDGSAWTTANLDLDLGTSYSGIDYKGTNPFETQTDQGERQEKLGSSIPVGVRQGLLTGAQVLNSVLSPQGSQTGQFIETGLNLLGEVTDTPSGPVYVGNAAGIISQGLDYATMFGFNVPGRGLTTSVSPDLQSGESKWKGKKDEISVISKGVWQFLFNPSELSLSVGPNYKETETWGVLDDANGGKPLHFTSLKNPELKFNKVLLNGYVFGRQVENLEQGLMELFMKNPAGNNPHGPQVLEFVWGQKTFGPCVIKNIQINEKMWDNGLLVNAEVSFTLVKVPEWTINDGQVSVYDPSSLPTTVGADTTGPVGTGTVPLGTDEPSSEEKTQPPETQEENFGTFQQCKNIQSDIDAAQQVSNKIKSNSYYQGSGFIYEGSILYPGSGNYRPTFPGNLNTYNSALSKYKSSSFYSPYMTGFLGEKCLNPTYNFKTAGYDNDYRALGGESNATKDQKIEIDKKYNAQLSSCADQLAGIRGPLEEAYRNLKCNNYHTNPGNSTERL